MMMCFTPTRTASFTISFTSGGELWPVARIRSPLLSRVFVFAMICKRLLHFRQQLAAVGTRLRIVDPERQAACTRATATYAGRPARQLVDAVLRVPARHPHDAAPSALHFGHVGDRPRIDLGAGREVRAHAAEDLHVGMELAHVVGQPGGLIEVPLDDEPAHAGRLGARVEIERVDRAGGLAVARPEAVGILVRVHVDRALQRRIVRRGIVQRVVRPSASPPDRAPCPRVPSPGSPRCCAAPFWPMPSASARPTTDAHTLRCRTGRLMAVSSSWFPPLTSREPASSRFARYCPGPARLQQSASSRNRSAR